MIKAKFKCLITEIEWEDSFKNKEDYETYVSHHYYSSHEVLEGKELLV